MSKFNNYRAVLVSRLVEFYNLSEEDAKKAVLNSSVEKMLSFEDEYSIWQMHQPLPSTVEEIFTEYEETFA